MLWVTPSHPKGMKARESQPCVIWAPGQDLGQRVGGCCWPKPSLNGEGSEVKSSVASIGFDSNSGGQVVKGFLGADSR